MFTGLVTHFGEVRSRTEAGDTHFRIAPGFATGALAEGASVAHAGVCLTVADIAADGYTVVASAETLARTTLGRWRPGTQINLERSLRVGDELGGHFVFGHVDAVGTLVSLEAVGDSHRLVFAAPDKMARYLAEKGSIAVDGVSLTINDVDGTRFGVNIIEHTWTKTTLGGLAVGDPVNLEADMLARYVERSLAR
ncbi:MAG: riboflavin synthase [Rhodospirillaceae bacterium]|nr:riboflavin synthase [Rhodospirillaceae bacterium]